MKRLTTDAPKDNIENALNLFYIKDEWTWVRGGGPAPDYADISLCDFVRMLVKAHIPDSPELPTDDDNLSMMMAEWLMDAPDTAEGAIALLYTAGWAFAELRHRLAYYEDLEEQGRLYITPCNLGQMVYRFQRYFNDATLQSEVKIKPCRIESISVDSVMTEDHVFMRFSDFGKTVFLTHAEAEQALK